MFTRDKRGAPETPSSRQPVATQGSEAEHGLSQCPRAVTALVWAADELQAAEAVEYLRHGLWPYWYLFKVADVRKLPLGVPRPWSKDDPRALACALRERWMWVLVPLGTDVEATVS